MNATKQMPKKTKEGHSIVERKHEAAAHGVGRRKASVARVWLERGDGKIIVNERDYLTYFDTDLTRYKVSRVHETVSEAKKYNAHVNLQGGGLMAQADAVRLGIARALLMIDENLKSILREYGFLTVDSRVKERKKYGQKGARRKFQFVKR